MRTLVIGAPRTGKTTAFPDALHTDSLIPRGWNNAITETEDWMKRPGPWTIEGVLALHALRHRLAASPDPPCDQIIAFWTPRIPLTRGQATMAKGLKKAWEKLLPEITSRGIEVQVME